MTDKIKLFEEQKVRTHWDEESQKWFFSVTDVVGILTDSPDPKNYWKVLKHRLAKEGNQSVSNCNQLKMQSSDGKFYKTDVADTEQLLRVIQSIPSPKAESNNGLQKLVTNVCRKLLTLNKALTGQERIGKNQEEAKSGFSKE